MQRQNTETRKEHSNRTNFDSPEKHRRMDRLLLLSALLLGAWVIVIPAEEPAGRDLGLFFQQNCVRCHGIDGSALGPDGKKLKGRDFTDKKWQQNTGDDEMAKTIMKGKFFGIAMPSYKDSLSKDEARRMVTAVIRKSRKGKTIGPEATLPSD